MKRFALASLTVAISLAAGMAQANSGYYNNDDRYSDSDYETTDVAQVESVDPIVDRSQARQRQECWNEPVNNYRRDDDRYYRSNDRNYNGNNRDRRNIGAGVIGGIIGGALGNQVGNGDGKKAATVAGAVVGYQIGKAVANRDDRRYEDRQASTYNGGQETVQRCRMVDDGYEERVIGYNVTYRYAGRTYRTVTDTHPGRTIQVRVAVQPVQRSSNVAGRY